MVDWLNRKWIQRLKKLKENSRLLTEDELINLLTKEGLTRENTIIVIQQLNSYLPNVGQFILHPDDDVIQDYDIDDEDLGDILLKIFKNKKHKFPSLRAQQLFFEQFGEKYTVRLLVQFVDHFGTKP